MQAPSEIVKISQFPSSWDEKDLENIFSIFGTVLACHIFKATSESVEALLGMDSAASAYRALIALDNYVPRDSWGQATGLPIHLEFSTSDVKAAVSHLASDNGVVRSYTTRSTSTEGSDAFDSIFDNRRASYAPSVPDSIRVSPGKWERDMAVHNGKPEASAAMNFWEAEALSQLSSSLESPASQASAEAAQAQRIHSKPGATPAPAAQSVSKSIYVSNLPPEADPLWVYERFAPYGGVLSVKVLQEQRIGKCKGVCFVNYMDPHSAGRAVQSLDGIKIAGRVLQVKLQVKRR